MYYIDRIGTDMTENDTRYNCFDDAQAVVYEEYKSIIEDYGDDFPFDLNSWKGNSTVLATREKYWSWTVREDVDGTLEEALVELDRAFYGLSEYSFELLDTYTCYSHIEKAKEAISAFLKEKEAGGQANV